ncbi:MAG: type VI secretion system baseplate subunit TssG [Telluria sp.]
MQATQRQHAAPVIERLLRDPHRFQAAQAWRLLAAAGVAVRFRNYTSMASPASEVAACIQTGDRVELAPASGGLLGALGALPYHYTEDLLASAYASGMRGQTAFVDLLTQRAYALAFEAWPGGCQAARLQQLQQALAGGCQTAVAVFYAALLRRTARNAAQIGRVLTSYFRAPIVIEEFVRERLALHDDERMALGKGMAALGRCVLGAAVWSRGARARVRIGPLQRPAYDDFLPGRAGAHALARMLAHFGAGTITFEVQLVLDAAAVPPLALHARPAGALGLGQGAVLPGPRDPDAWIGVRYEFTSPGSCDDG